MEPATLTAAPDLAAFIRTFLGENFGGYVVLYEGQSKKAHFFTSARLDLLCDRVGTLKEWADVYIALGTQQDDVGPKKRGGAKSVVTLGSFFADIDFAADKDNDKAYPPDEATARRILEEFEYPPTALIRTGNGLHAHWAFPQPIGLVSPAERAKHQELHKAFARKLGELFGRHGYEIDNVSDLARVYRAPGTYNRKSPPPKPVELIVFRPDVRVPAALLTAPASTSRRGERPKERRREHPLAQHEKIRQGCAWYGHFTGEGAAGCPEPDWYAAASITARTVDGEAIFHAYSRRHPGYKQREAEAKFKRSLDDAGPRTCQAIRDGGNEQFCGACPHWEKITSPIQLGAGYDPGPDGPIPLGYTQQGLYALLDQRRKIVVQLTAGQLLAYTVLIGMADRTFWRSRFPGAEDGFDAGKAGEALIKACVEEGPFDPLRIRGRGVWIEGDNVVVNLGAPVPAGLRNLYLCFEPLAIQSVPSFPTRRLWDLFELFPWRRRKEAVLLLGWLAIAPVCGALRWRPHVFIYGPPNSGKTTLHGLAGELLYPLGLAADGQSTEPGLRQTLGPDSRPIVLDEFETDQRSGRIAAIIRLARSASSAESPVLRGTQEGRALQYSVRTTMLFSAVNVVGMAPADETRILMLELKAHENNDEIRRRIAAERQFFAGLGPQWCGWMAANVTHLAEAINTFEIALSGANSRLRLNMATLLSGAFVALHGRPPDEVEAATWAADYAETVAFQGQAHERNDSQEALDFLFAYQVRQTHGPIYPLGHWIAAEWQALEEGLLSNDPRESERIVAMHDMRLMLDDDAPGLMIKHGSSVIDAIYKDTRWANGAWSKALHQLTGAFSPDDPIYFPNSKKKYRAVGIPLELIPDAYTTAADEEAF